MNNNGLLLTRAKEISKSMNSKFWELGPVLIEIKKNKPYLDIGYQSFHNYCDDELYCSYRTIQFAIKLHNWKCCFSSKTAVKWIETVPWSNLKIFHSFVNDKNWKEWRKEYEKRKPTDFKRYFAEWKRFKKYVSKNNMDDIDTIIKNVSFHEDPIIYLKNSGLENTDIADELGIKDKDIRKNAKFIKCHIPDDVYIMIVENSRRIGISIEEEIVDTLTAVYRQDNVKETG